MNFFYFSLILAAVVCCSQAWNDLLVRWSLNPLHSNKFNALPKDEQFAIKEGWTKISGCNSNNNRGNRYILKNDYAVVLVFDNFGKIAGISAEIPKNASYNFSKEFFVDEEPNRKHFSINAYFTDPSNLCINSLPSQNFGDKLVIEGDKRSFEAQLLEANIKNDKFWTQGRCLPTMGNII